MIKICDKNCNVFFEIIGIKSKQFFCQRLKISSDNLSRMIDTNCESCCEEGSNKICYWRQEIVGSLECVM